jgi:hypothetical protein
MARGSRDPQDRIAVDRHRIRKSGGRVNPVYTKVVERIHAFDWNRMAVPIKYDPL